MTHVITTDLKIDNIERAASVIDPVFRNSPQFVDEQLCAALSGCAGVVRIEGAPHASNLTHPDQVNPPLLEFLRGLG